VAANEVAKVLFSRDARRALSAQVAQSLLRGANVREDELEEVAIQDPLAPQAHWRDSQSLLADLRGIAGEASRSLAAHVGVMGAIGDQGEEPPFDEDRGHEGHIGEMGASRVGVVENHDVARP
jgi:hypothetical protein